MYTIRHGVFATAVIVVACRGTVPDASPQPQEVAPTESEPLDLRVDVPTRPVPPEVGEKGCVDYRDADRYLAERDAYLDALERKEAARHGWRRLTEFTAVEYTLTEPQRFEPDGDVRIARRMSDRFVDTQGRTWLAIDEYGCEPPSAPYYIDEENTVFTVQSAPRCEQTTSITVCGTWPVDGCGAPPDSEKRRFARVPRRARLSARSAALQLDAMSCYEFEPQRGYEYPP